MAMAQSEDFVAKDRHDATLRKQNQLAEAEREHDRLVKEEEAEEAAEVKRKEDEAEARALE